MAIVWKASASATHLSDGGRVLLGRSRFCSNLTPSSSIPLCRTPLYSTLTATPSYWDLKSPTPLKPLQFQPKHKPSFAIWGIEDLQFQPKHKPSFSSALEKLGALLVLAAVLLLSNPLSAQARLSPALKYHVLNQMKRSTGEQDTKGMKRSTGEQDTKDTKEEEAPLVVKISFAAVCAIVSINVISGVGSVPEARARAARARAGAGAGAGGGDIIVLQLQFRYPSKGVAIPLIDEYKRVLDNEKASPNLCLFVNGLALTLLTYQRQCISASSFACVKGSLPEAHARLTYLHAEQYESLKDQSFIDVTALHPKESDNVFALIYVDMILKGNYELSSLNGIKSVKDAVDKILSIPLDHIRIIKTNCKYWAKEGSN